MNPEAENWDILPDGAKFAFWEDETEYSKIYHVAQVHPGASDANSGTEDQPFVSIGRAAEILKPGEKVVIHSGVYRECVQPSRGGTAVDRMIAYECAPAEKVEVKGSVEWQPEAKPSEGWKLPQPKGGATVWMADLPESNFNAYNPFLVRNAYQAFDVFADLSNKEFLRRAMMRRGTVYLNGERLQQRSWECAGLKFHLAENCLIRCNIFRHLRHAGGIWLDCHNVNNRVANNVLTNIVSLTGAIYSELNYDVNLVDHNVIWDIRVPPGESHESTNFGSGLPCDCNEKMVAVHNLFGKIEGDAVMFSLIQSHRKIDGRTGLCRSNTLLNNVFYKCRHRLHLGRREENRSDGNLFDVSGDDFSFHIAYPEPGCYQNLAGWQDFFGLDTHSTQTRLEFDFNADTLTLTWQIHGETPVCQSVDGSNSKSKGIPGPFEAIQWQRSLAGDMGKQRFPTE